MKLLAFLFFILSIVLNVNVNVNVNVNANDDHTTGNNTFAYVLTAGSFNLARNMYGGFCLADHRSSIDGSGFNECGKCKRIKREMIVTLIYVFMVENIIIRSSHQLEGGCCINSLELFEKVECGSFEASFKLEEVTPETMIMKTNDDAKFCVVAEDSLGSENIGIVYLPCFDLDLDPM